MQKGLKIDGQMRALAVALGSAIVTSVIAMFIPVSVFESITGATGISELVPATAAPLGDTARAIIAFGFGAAAFAVVAMYLLRQPAKGSDGLPVSPASATAAPVADGGVSLIARAKAKISDFVESRRNPDAVKELSDLPKLRAGDAHPDAPPRRPISAHRDFGEIATERVVEEPVVAPVEDVVELSTAEPPTDPATVTNMVDRLEWAVAERQEQIAKLEALASAEIAKPELPVQAAEVEVEAMTEPDPEPEPEPTPQPVPEVITPGTRPSIFGQPVLAQAILEVVPSEPANEPVEDDMDAALRSALETLQRMNARTR